MEIKIQGHDNGTFAIETNLAGPVSLVKVLRAVIEHVEQAAMQSETRAAAAAVKPATTSQVEAILAARGRNGVAP